jgi:2-polyprenyl-6-methoxyphenol hydroxylase-like FAD-dependent oxidoreductase
MTTEQTAGPGTLEARCCVVGGGPAGVMLGFLFARAGIEVVVLEKHADFFRDFRGDTIHPTTFQLMHELGLLDDFLKVPHQEVRELSAQIGATMLKVADFTHLPTVCKFLGLMPQWDFLNFVADRGRRYPRFHLRTETEVIDLIYDGERVEGVRASTPHGPLDVRAELVVGADGRRSVVRARAGLQVEDKGAPIDVLWLRVSRKPSDPPQTLGRVDFGKVLIMLNRDDYWQCAFVIRKGGFEEIRRRGLPAFRERIAVLAPFLRERLEELRDWDDISLLTVAVDRLQTWYRPGLLCIGDAAHAMSPIGGVGINLAIQDAVAAANILVPAFAEQRLNVDALRAVQRRRAFPAALTQRVQIFIQNRILSRVLSDDGRQMSAPFLARLIDRWPLLRRIPAYAVGIGVRPEHVRTPENAGQPFAAPAR